MPKSLSLTARSTHSVGIAGFLPEDANVFYTQLFNAYSVGRVSDLLTARLRKDGWQQELGVRAVLLLAVFEASLVVDSGQPISLETGTSADRVIIGFSFLSSRLTTADIQNAIERVQSYASETEFDYLIENLRRYADAFMIRLHEGLGRVDFIFGLDRQKESVTASVQCEIEQATIPPGKSVEMQVKTYEELGDLNHQELLESEKTKADRRPKSEKEFRIEGGKTATAEAQRVVKGTQEKTENSEEQIIAGEKPEAEGSTEVTSGLKSLFKKVWPFKSPPKEAAKPTSEEEVVVSGKKEEKTPEVEKVFKSNEPEVESEITVKEKAKQKKEEEALVQAAESAEADPGSNLSATELMAERSKLVENGKKLSQALRQKELEFKNKEQAMTAEVRKRDEMLKQRESALNHTKEQLQKMMSDVEKLKLSGKSSSNEEASLKNKIQQAHQALLSEKKQRDDITKKLEEVRAQMATLQLSNKAQKSAVTDAEALREKLARSHKETDELRRQVRDLQEKMKNEKKEAANSEGDEFKARYEMASKAAAAEKKNAERLTRQLEEIRREDMRLKVEVSRLQGELRRARLQANQSQNAQAMAEAKEAKEAAKERSEDTDQSADKPWSKSDSKNDDGGKGGSEAA